MLAKPIHFKQKIWRCTPTYRDNVTLRPTSEVYMGDLGNIINHVSYSTNNMGYNIWGHAVKPQRVSGLVIYTRMWVQGSSVAWQLRGDQGEAQGKGSG